MQNPPTSAALRGFRSDATAFACSRYTPGATVKSLSLSTATYVQPEGSSPRKMEYITSSLGVMASYSGRPRITWRQSGFILLKS